jgi:hypothetical protein
MLEVDRSEEHATYFQTIRGGGWGRERDTQREDKQGLRMQFSGRALV